MDSVEQEPIPGSRSSVGQRIPKVFVATSLRHGVEARRVLDILERLHLHYQCCVFDRDSLDGQALFAYNVAGIVNSDLCIVIVKELGVDVAAEVGMAYAFGKPIVGVDYGANRSDVMAYFALRHLVTEDRVEEVVQELLGIRGERSSSTELPFCVPLLQEHKQWSLAEIARVFDTQRYVAADYTNRLERAVGERLGRPTLAVASGTTGLIAIWDALLNEGRHEVIVPSLTFPATIQAILHAGGIPVFADVLETDWTMDPEHAGSLITPHTAGLMPVHLLGCPARVREFEAIAASYGLSLVFDACEAFGATTVHGPVGSFGAAEVFSLDASKLFSGVQGGLVSVESDELALRLREVREFGMDTNKVTRRRGLNGRMSELHAIVACGSIRSVDRELARTRELVAAYKAALGSLAEVCFQAPADGFESANHYLGVYLRAGGRSSGAAAKDALRLAGIEARVFNPVDLHRLSFVNRQDSRLPVTEQMRGNLLCLPLHAGVTADHIGRVRHCLAKVLRQ